MSPFMLEGALPQFPYLENKLPLTCSQTRVGRHPRTTDAKETSTAASPGNSPAFHLPLPEYLDSPWCHTKRMTWQTFDEAESPSLDLCKCCAAFSQGFLGSQSSPAATGTGMLLLGESWWLWMRRLLRNKMLFHTLPLSPPLTRCYLIAPDSSSARSRV